MSGIITIMAYNRFIHVTGPRTLVDLATHSLFLVVSKILPETTREVKRCHLCKFTIKNDNFDGVEGSPCNCFQYYQHVLGLYRNLPVELRQEILEIAQRELDNTNSVQTLLAIWMSCIDLLISSNKQGYQDGEHLTDYGLKSITTPIYLYNDHDSRELILQQLIRIVETYNSNNPENDSKVNSTFQHQINSEDRRLKYTTFVPTTYLSFNMYRFNDEIGKREYVINLKHEREPENQECEEESSYHVCSTNVATVCNCVMCNYIKEKLLLNKVLMLYSPHVHTLILPTLADTNLLFTLSTLASNLKVLDMSFSVCVDDETISSTIGKDDEDNVCKQLRQIYLEGTSVTEKAVLNILHCQQNLEHVESEFLTSALTNLIRGSQFMHNTSLQTEDEPTVQLSSIGENDQEEIVKRKPLCLTQLFIQNERCGITSQRNPDLGPHRLEDYDQYQRPSAEHLSLLRKLGNLCPHIQYLTFPRLHSNQLPVLQQMFKNLPFLAHLHIGEIKIRFLEPLLSQLGTKLLSFQHSDFSDIVDLQIIAAHCSSLKSLAVNGAAVVMSGDDINDNPFPSQRQHVEEYESENICRNKKSYLFPDLKEISFNIHAIIPKYVWTHLFKECHALEGIDITSADSMTDGNLLSILTSHGFSDHEHNKQGIKGEHLKNFMSIFMYHMFYVK